MNFLNFLTTGASFFNFSMQNLSLNRTVAPICTEPLKDCPEEIMKDRKDSNFTAYEPSPAYEASPVVSSLPVSQLPKETGVELFTQQQQLINQYMHLNIQLLSQKLQNLEQVDKHGKVQESVTEVKCNKKKIKKTNTCGHHDKQHYAKGMCSNCYHKYGRTKKPWNCPHEKLYANGMCQNCYINQYNKKKREERSEYDREDIPSEVKQEENFPQ